MLSGLKVLDQREAERVSKEHKREQKQKDKKRKAEKEKKRRHKHKKKHRHHDSESGKEREKELSSDGSSESGGDDAEHGNSSASDPGEEQVAGQTGAGGRDSWMTDSSLFSQKLKDAKSKRELAEEQKEADRKESDKPKVTDRELNPYLKDGGSGLPPEEEGGVSGVKKTVVGDGGASWRMKALKRAREQAKEQGKDLDEAVAERWGSLSQLTAGITDSRRSNPSQRYAGRSGLGDGRDGGRTDRGGQSRQDRASYLTDMKDDRPRMRRPDDSIQESWKRRGDSGGLQRGREEAVWDRADGSRRGCEDGTGGRGDRRSNTEHALKRDTERRSRHDSRSMRDQVEHDTERRGKGGRQQAGHDACARDRDCGILSEVAGSMNKFSNDGSFLEAFAKDKDADQANEDAAGDKPYELPKRFTASEDDEDPPQETASNRMDRVVEGREDAGAMPNVPSAGANRPSALVPMSDAGGNRTVADLIRARLGNKGKPIPASQETIQLPLVDSRGRAAPGAFGRDAAGSQALPEGNRIPRKTERYGAEGAKERYFRDDDKKSLNDLVREQRYEGSEDIDRNLARNITKKARFKGNELDADDEYDNDGGIEMYEDKRKQGTREAQAQRSKAAQVSDYKRMQSAQDRCTFCFNSQARQRLKHLTIAIGQTAYLMLPAAGRLVPGHCQIATVEHVPSSRAAEDHVWTEIRNFKKCILQMVRSQGKDIVFLETAMHLGGGRGHCVIDCIPVPKDVGADAPIYFKQELNESESEWSQHHAKSVIDTSLKGLRGSIPDNFPYFHVEFGLTGGYAHIIDDEEKWNTNFGRDVLIGMLGLPEDRWNKRARQESHSVQQQWVTQFSKEFRPFDWTLQL